MRPPFHIKICGITTPTDALVACELGAGAIGVNFYPDSKRFVGANLAVQICNAIDRYNFDHSDLPNIWKVGLFVDASAAEVASHALTCGLNAIQLHGNEKSGELQVLLNLLEERHPGCRFFRAIRVDTNAISQSTEVARVQAEIGSWTSAGVHAILLDAATPSGQFGGTGEIFDWNIVSTLQFEVPVILAGGLNPKNVAEAISISGVSAVDVASGVESEPGVKDPALVAAFVAACREALVR